MSRSPIARGTRPPPSYSNPQGQETPNDRDQVFCSPKTDFEPMVLVPGAHRSFGPAPHVDPFPSRDHRRDFKPHLLFRRFRSNAAVRHPSRISRAPLDRNAHGSRWLVMGQAAIDISGTLIPHSSLEALSPMGSGGDVRDHLFHGPLFPPALAMVLEG